MVQKEIKLNTSHLLPDVRAKETRGGQKKKKKISILIAGLKNLKVKNTLKQQTNPNRSGFELIQFYFRVGFLPNMNSRPSGRVGTNLTKLDSRPS